MLPAAPSRLLRRCAASLWIVSLAASSTASAQEDTSLVDAVVRLWIQDGPEQVIPALSYNSTMLIPLQRFLELSEIPLAEFAYGDSAVVTIEPGGVPVTFLPDSGRIVRGDSVFAIAPLDAVWSQNELFVATGTIDRAFDVGTRMEWSDLTVYVGRSHNLPVIRRLRRERRRARLTRPTPMLPDEFSATPSSALADGAVFEWSFNTQTRDPLDQFAMHFGLGAQLLEGSVELRYQRRNYGTGALSELRGSWARAWPEHEWIRQVRVGDVFSNGLRARSVQGLAITNAPFIRSSEFDVDEVLGHIQAGWEVEVYDRGRLRAYHEVDARGVYRTPLQLRYGQNAFQFVLYGPGGEVVRETRTIRVPFSRLPTGKLEYAVAGGRCRTEDCVGLLTADVRYGLNSRITLQAGSDQFWRDSERFLWQPYAAVSAAVLPELNLTGEAVYDGRLRASVDYEHALTFRASASHTIFDRDGSRATPESFERHRTEGSIYWRPEFALRNFTLHLTGMHSTGPAMLRSLQQLTATAYVARVRYRFGLRHDRTDQVGAPVLDRSGVDLGAETVLAGPSPWLRATNVRTALGFDAGEGLALVRGGIGRQIKRKVRVDLSVGWERETGFSIDLSLNTITTGPRFGSRNHYTAESGATGMMFADGSVIFDPDERYIHLSDGRDLGRAGVTGTVFFDENGNGVRDSHENGLGGVPLHIGGWFDETDASGRFSAWDLFPFEASYIVVDSMGFEDPRLVPAATMIKVIPTPNSFQAIDVPVVIGAEVSGYVVFQNAGLAGVPVVLRNVATGRSIGLLTFSDGMFYKIAVQPGDYEVLIPQQSLETLGAIAAPIRLHIPSGQGEKRVEDLVINLERVSHEPGLLDKLIQNQENRLPERIERHN